MNSYEHICSRYREHTRWNFHHGAVHGEQFIVVNERCGTSMDVPVTDLCFPVLVFHLLPAQLVDLFSPSSLIGCSSDGSIFSLSCFSSPSGSIGWSVFSFFTDWMFQWRICFPVLVFHPLPAQLADLCFPVLRWLDVPVTDLCFPVLHERFELKQLSNFLLKCLI